MLFFFINHVSQLVRSFFVDVIRDEIRRLMQPFPRVLKVQRLSDDSVLPVRGSDRAAGFDLFAAEGVIIPPLSRALIKTDLAITVPRGTYGRIAPRSGLSLKKSIDVAGGVIDEDYTGNVGIILVNNGVEEFEVVQGTRIAQLVCEKICFPELEEVVSLDATERGDGGFGSSGSN